MSAPTITVVGPGRMGIGIVSVFATAGHRVRLLDVKERSESERAEKFEHVLSEVQSHLDFLTVAGRFDGDRQDVVDQI